jgi:predicted nucleotidyltransferase
MGSEVPGLDAAALRRLCRRHHIRRLALFGSYLKGEAKADSDLDILVEFEPGHVPGLIRIAGIQTELEALAGRRVDLRTLEDLSRYFRADVAQNAEVLFATP